MTVDESEIRQYLLGQLGPKEQEWVEQRIMTDPEFYRRVSLVEDDLTDEYASDLLSEDERRSFENRFMPVPRRRVRLKMAELLTGASDSRRVENIRDHRRADNAAPAVFTIQQSRAVIASLVLLLLIGTPMIWLLLKTRESSGKKNEIQAVGERENSEEQTARGLADLKNQVDELSRRLQREEEYRVDLERQLAELRKSGTGAAESGARVTTFLLTPGLLRESGQANRIELSEPASRVRLQLKLGTEPQELYRAALRSDDGKVIWRRENLRAQRSLNGPVVIVSVSAGVLESGDYTLRLEASDRENGYNRTGTYYLRVVAK